MRVDLTTMQVKAVVSMLRDEIGDDPDERLVLDTLEGETNLFEISARLLSRIEDEDGAIKVLAEQISDRKARSDKSERRKESYRLGLRALIEAAGLDKIQLPEATVTIRDLDDRLDIDAEAVPDSFKKPVYKPDAEKIKQTFLLSNLPLPNWLTRETGRRSITIRRK